MLSDFFHIFCNSTFAISRTMLMDFFGDKLRGQHSYGLKQGWQLDDLGYEALQDSSTWAEFYERLAIHSRLVRDESAFLIDKTPPYQAVIEQIAQRFDVPIVIIIKDPVLLYDSWSQRRATNIEQFAQYYRGRAAASLRARAAFPEQVLLIRYEDLVADSDVMMERVFEHIGIEPMLLPQTMQSDFPEKVPTTVSQDIAMRLTRVGERHAHRLRQHLPDLCYLDNAGQLLRQGFWT